MNLLPLYTQQCIRLYNTLRTGYESNQLRDIFIAWIMGIEQNKFISQKICQKELSHYKDKHLTDPS